MANEDKLNPQISRCLIFSRVLFFVGLGLQIAGGCLEGSDSASDVDIGVKLVKAGYSCVVVFVACLLGVQGYFWMNLSSLSRESKMVGASLDLMGYHMTDVLFTDSSSYGYRPPIHRCSHHVSFPFGHPPV